MKTNFLTWIVAFGAVMGSGCALNSLNRLENPNLALPIRDLTAAEIVGSKVSMAVDRTPDRVWPSWINGSKPAEKPGDYDLSETIHWLPVGRSLIEVRYSGINWAINGVMPRMPFIASAEIPLEAVAATRYQVKGSVDGDHVLLWVARLPDGSPVTEKYRAEMFDMTITGKLRPRKGGGEQQPQK